MSELPPFLWIAGAAALLVLALFGLRGILEIRDALRLAEFSRLTDPPCWTAARALAGVMAGLPILFTTRSLGPGAWLATLVVATLAFVLAPEFLRAAQRR